ncbi:MAG: GDP-L-fucose synthase [Gammaproteobacteria bacterium]|nr:GDP-L-fucose synthase [Gammaproteobacteria bacterium]
MEKDAKIYIAGHNGLVGSAICRRLQADGYSNLLLRSSKQLDLRDQGQVRAFFSQEKPDYVFMAAAKVGGIHANNTYRADFIMDNLQIQNNIIDASYKNDVRKFLFLGSSCIYPKLAPQPIKEEYLLTGPLEATNEPYAIAKIAGIKTIEAYRDQYGFNGISLMPTNLYGYGDNFDLNNSHVLPALLRKFHEAKENGSSQVVVWGSGTPKREFLFVDDLADAALFLMEKYESSEIINVGVGEDVTIAELADLIKRTVGYQGEIVYEKSKPDGTPRKLLDVSRINGLGWKASTSLEQGLKFTYQWYLENTDKKGVVAKA